MGRVGFSHKVKDASNGNKIGVDIHIIALQYGLLLGKIS